MTLAIPTRCHDDTKTMRERRCIVTGRVLPESGLIRFVAAPDGAIVPDLAAKLPGRGLWVSAERAILEAAVAKNQFARAAGSAVKPDKDLAGRVESLIVRRMLDELGLARRSGALVLGYDAVARSLDAKNPPDLLIEASDGATDGRRKLLALAAARGRTPRVIDCFSSAELSLALGRENVVHAALKPGRLSERLGLEAGRLKGLRPATGPVGP